MPEIRTLYQRLRDRGFDRRFLQGAVVPDWWEDSLAENPANLAIAEIVIARHLGFTIADLRNSERKLPGPPISDYRFRRMKKTRPSEILPALVVAQRAARLVVTHCPALPGFTGQRAAQEIRALLLEECSTVNLETLARFCWANGIVVLHIEPRRFPQSSKRFQGLSLFRDKTPAIVLASGRDGPPWLAFHLAHELGHIMLGHVAPDKPPIVDSELDARVNDAEEKTTDEFATEVLTGVHHLSIEREYGLTAPKLAAASRAFGRDNAIDPGSVSLIYGRSAERWPVAQRALQLLEQDQGAHEMIARELLRHLATENMSDSAAQFLEFLSVSRMNPDEQPVALDRH